MTICPGKDASGVACSRPQSICIARGFVQWGPRSPSGWACQLPLYNCQPSSGHLPRLLASLPPLPCCPCAHGCIRPTAPTHTGWPSPSPRPRHLPTPWPLAIGLGASILKDGTADCSGSDLHVLSFDVF